VAEYGGEDQGVQGAPGIQLPPVDLEPVRGGTQGDAVPDDAALLVVLGVRKPGEGLAHLVGGAAGGLSEVLDGDRLAQGEQL